MNTSVAVIDHQGYKLEKRKKVGEERYLTPENHTKLVSHCYNLMNAASDQRSKRINTMRSIEADLLGVSDPIGSDCDRAQQRAEGRGAATPDRIYPFGYLKLQGYAAELAAIVMPYEAPYATVTKQGDQDKSDAITKALRYSAAVFDHRNHVHSCIFDALALDLFAARITWDVHGHSQSTNGIGKGAAIMKIEGAAIQHLDPYNISFDTSIPLDQVAENGEFFAEYYLTSKFQLKRMRANGEIFLSKEEMDMITPMNYISGHQELGSQTNLPGYYYDAVINEGRKYAAKTGGEVQTDFREMFGGYAAPITGDYVPKGIQTTKMLVRLEPREFGLDNKISGSNMQIYEITIAGNGMIVRAEPQPDNGGRFNVVLGSMSFDREFGRHMIHGDTVADLSALASSILNTFKRSRRQSLEGGVTIYNPNVVPLHKLDDMMGGRLATEQMRFDADLRKHVMQLSSPPDTKNDVNDTQALLALLDTMLPSNSQPELAGLDRATEFQAQAVAMTGDRKQMFHASILDGQLMTPIRWQLQLLVMQNATEMIYVDEKTKQAVSLAASDIQGTQFMLTQPSTLVGVDRLRITNLLNSVVNMTLQAGDQMSPLTMVLLKHLIDISGITIDLADYQEAADAMMQAQQQQQQADLAAQAAQAGQPGPTQGDI